MERSARLQVVLALGGVARSWFGRLQRWLLWLSDVRRCDSERLMVGLGAWELWGSRVVVSGGKDGGRVGKGL